MTKSEEKILDGIRRAHAINGLRGLGTSPADANWNDNEHRFVRRLYEAGKIVWVPYSSQHGAGWALPEFAVKLAS
jgi:hypothetical protein